MNKKIKKSNILITGGNGFVGRNLVPLLKNKKKYNIKILSRKKGWDLKNYNSIKNSFKNIDTIIHLAYSKNYPENIKMTENLIKVSKENKIKKIILLSSMSAKRNHPDAYGKNKLEIENMIKNSGLNYTILRPSIIYGKGSKSFDFMINYIKKIPFFTPIIGTGKYIIIPVHISDVVNVIGKCIKNKKTDKKDYDIVGGEKIYFINLINLLKKEIKVNKRNIQVPLFVCNIIASFLPRIINKENIKNLTEDSLANISNTTKDLGYKPIKLKEGLKHGLI